MDILSKLVFYSQWSYIYLFNYLDKVRMKNNENEPCLLSNKVLLSLSDFFVSTIVSTASFCRVIFRNFFLDISQNKPLIQTQSFFQIFCFFFLCQKFILMLVSLVNYLGEAGANFDPSPPQKGAREPRRQRGPKAILTKHLSGDSVFPFLTRKLP